MAQTVRVSEATHARLRDLAARMDQPLARVLEAAVREYERTVFWEQNRNDVAALKADTDASVAQQEDDRLWGWTAADGLEADDVWTDADVIANAHTPAR